MRHIRLFSLIFAAQLTACAVGPDFKTPAAPDEKSYTSSADVLPAAERVALGKQLQAEWWTLFASKPLDSVMAQAMAGNEDIASARETLAAATEAVKAENGNFFPRVSAEATAGRQKYGVALFGPSAFVVPPFNYYEAGPSASWTLDIFGGERRRAERERALAEYQSHALDAAYVTLTGNVALTAMEIAEAKAEIATVNNIVAEDEKTLTLTEKTLQAGAGTKLDVLSAKSQRDADRALLPPLEQRLSAAQHALAILTGKAPASWSPPEFALADFTLPQTLPVSLPSELVHKRPDILAAEANLHAASAAIGVATANLYPSLTLSANTLQEALSPNALFKGVSNAWALAANASVPIYSGGKGTAEKREAEHAYKAALAEYRQTILYAFGQVADDLTALAHDEDQLTSEQQAQATAADSLTLARKSYEAGNTGLLVTLDAERSASRAQLALIRAESARYRDTARLFVALAGSPVK